MGISTNPEHFTEGTFDDFVGTVIGAEYELYDYGKGGETFPFLALDVEIDGLEAGKTYRQRWKAGSAEDFAPSKDRKELVAVGKKTTLNKDSNMAIFCRSLQEAGMPADIVHKIGDDCTVLVGARLHFVRVPYNRRIGGELRQDQVLMCEKVLDLPGKKAAGEKPKGKGKAKKSKAEAEEFVLSVLN